MSEHFDVAIVGAGIVGLSQAYEASRRGLRTIILERSPWAQGASIRNFGMLWPIGQPEGALRQIALRSRAIWVDVCGRAGLWHDACGSVHLVTREDELAVLEEFVERSGGPDHRVELWDRQTVLARSPAARRDTVIGGMFSPDEVCVDSPRAVAGLARWLREEQGVTIRWSQPVTRIEAPAVYTATGVVEASRIIVCSGADFEQLYPEAFADVGIRRCKLQMLAAESQPGNWRLGPMVASGLTLRHYENFAACRSLSALRERVAREQPLLDRFGIHVMASQHSNGEIILGDSHEYDADISPFDKSEIDELMLAELHRIIDLPSWRISRSWNGTYAKMPGRAVYTRDPAPGVRVVNATGGSGMTMSFGLAERLWENWDDFKI